MAYTDGPGAGRTGTVRFDVIGEAWQKISANMGAWVVAALIVCVVLWVIIGGFYVGVFASAMAAGASGNDNVGAGVGIITQLMGMLMGFAINVIQFVLMGGMVKMALNQIRGLPISAGDIFKGFEHFVPLALGGLLYSLGIQIGAIFCIIPGLLLAGLWMLTVPLIVDQNMDAVTALTTSLKTLQPHMWSALGVYLVLGLVAGLGSLLCGIGMIITYPFLPIGVALVYKDFYPERFQGNSAQQDL